MSYELELLVALRPFLDAYKKRCDRYDQAKSAWIRDMPGAWPVTLEVNIDDCRTAHEAVWKAVRALSYPDHQKYYSVATAGPDDGQSGG